jgi:TolB protein
MRLAVLALGLVLLLQGSVSAQGTGDLPGRVLFVKDGDLWVWQDGGARQLGSGGTWSQPSWAPSGGYLAYVYRGTNFADIFVTDDQGQSQLRLTDSQSTILENNDWNFRPTWSPDGKQIAFVSDRATTFPVLYLMDAADGTGVRRLPVPGVPQEGMDALSWSPDGTQIAVTVFNEPGPSQIAVIPLSSRQTGKVLTTLPGGALDPAWSPDGAWLAYAGHDGGSLEVRVVRADGTSDQALTQDGAFARAPVWSPDGRHLAYLSSRTGFFELWVIDIQADATTGALTASQPRQLTQDLHIDAASGLSWGQ